MFANKVLFIGGSKDGQTMTVPDENNILEIVVPAKGAALVGNAPMTYPKTERYYRYPINGGKVIYQTFVLTTVPQDQVIGMLLERYARQ